MKNGKLLITYKDGKVESFPCKSEGRAQQIIAKRCNVREWKFYEPNQSIPKSKKKIVQERIPQSFEELDMIIKSKNLGLL